MKFDKKKRDALSAMVWAVLSIANLLALFLTRESVYGFLLLFCTIWFLNEDREYKEKYPEKKEENNQK